MNRRNIIGLILTASILTGCGTTNSVKQPLPANTGSKATYQVANIEAKSGDVPQKFKNDVRKYLEKDLKKKGMLAKGEGHRKVNVTITEFQMAEGASRLLFGAFAGKDYVKADINVIDSASNKVIGATTITSQDKMAGGGTELFSSYHAKAISKFLQGKS